MKPKPPIQLSDRTLVHRARAGDARAFEAIVQRYRGYVYAVCVRRCFNPADAEEVTMETFARFHRYIKGFRGDCSLKSYLHSIARNAAANRQKREDYRGFDMKDSMDKPIAFTSARSPLTLADIIMDSNDLVGYQLMDTSEFNGAVDAAVAQLAEDQQAIFSLRRDQELQYDELASALAIPMGTVKSRLNRARNNIIAAMVERYPEWRDWLVNRGMLTA